LSGGNHARSIIESHGYLCADDEKAAIAQFIKDKSKDRRKGISDRELMRIYNEFRQPMTIESVDYGREGERSSVTIKGKFFGDEGWYSADHSGQESALAALKALIESRFGPYKIISHSSRSDSQGINAKSVSQVIVQLEDGGQFEGAAHDHDIEISAMRALIDAVNKAYVYQQYAINSPVNRKEEECVAPVSQLAGSPRNIA
jgi:hypothetical protein